MNLFNLFHKPKPPRRPLPPVVIRRISSFLDGSFVAPNEWISVEVFNQDESVKVGMFNYGVSPLRDRIYVDGLNVVEAHQRKGFGSSALLTLAKQCSDPEMLMPIAALHELYSAIGFWGALRNGYVPSLVVLMDIRTGDQAEEKRRWQK